MNSALYLIRKFCSFISILRAIPLALISVSSANFSSIEKDLERAQKTNKYSSNLLNLADYLVSDKYYRTIFYHKIGRKAKLFRWLLPTPELFTIPLYTTIGKGTLLYHPYCTYLNAKSIGENFTCRHSTTIGNKNDEQPEAIPTIGDNVSIGAHVIVLGNIIIGNNVIIGAGSVVVNDVPDNCVVAGNPAKIIRNI